MKNNKITSSFITGAIGDALGAPIEGLRQLNDITDKYGENGLNQLISYESHFEKGVTYKAGSITDDTTMTVTTAFAIIKAAEESVVEFSPNFLEKLNYYSWQGYLNWASKQIYYPLGDKLIDKSVKWPDAVKDFWFACGAGKGTLAALCQEKYGTLEQPLNFECKIEGKVIKTPNLGCGGMMRIAPIAFIPNFTDAEIFETACSNAAITHGAQEAYVATGITALFIRNAAKDLSFKENIAKTKETLKLYKEAPIFKDGVSKCLNAIDYAVSAPGTFSFKDIDNLPKGLGYKNPFLAVPVLAQVTYAMLSAKKPEDVRETLILSANHSGDSDSVAAITGNILGAMFTKNSARDEWEEKICLKHEIEQTTKKIATILKI